MDYTYRAASWQEGATRENLPTPGHAFDNTHFDCPAEETRIAPTPTDDITPFDSTPTNDTPWPSLPPTARKLTAAGIMCDFIVANSKSLPVIVLHGEVHCPTALTTAQHYINNLAQSQGQGHFLTIDNWTCSWPNVEGRSHAMSYHHCEDTNGNTFKIGN